ncbi:MAG: DUF2769 domain-containing protein [Methanotrichaceae archaeon]
MAKLPTKPQKSPLVELNDKNANRCLCPGCPTYLSSPCPNEKGENIFCSIGLTECQLKQKNCLCFQGCRVYKDYGLKVGYFCLKGEASQNGAPVQSV